MDLKIYLKENSTLNRFSFGEFMKQRRKELGQSIRDVSSELEVSPAYICDIEQGNRHAPVKMLKKLEKVLKIEVENQKEFEDLAYLSHETCAPDLIQYLIENKMARVAIRSAIEENISGEKLYNLVQNRKEKTNDINWIFTKLSSNN